MAEEESDRYFEDGVSRAILLHLHELEDLDEVQFPTLSSIHRQVRYPKNAIFNAITQLSLEGLIAAQKLSGASGQFAENLANDTIFIRLSDKGTELATEINDAMLVEGDNSSAPFDVIYDAESEQPIADPVAAVRAAGTHPTSTSSKPPRNIVNIVNEGFGLAETAEIVPAANRYVSVSDNQNSFDEIKAELSKIKNEFAKDHNKGELDLDNLDARLADIYAFEAQVDGGWVSGRVAQNLKETLEYIADVCKSVEQIVTSASKIIALLSPLLLLIVI